MADDDERGSRDNTGHDYKPENAQNNENAPRGKLGTNKLTPTGPSLGGSSRKKWITQTAEQNTPSSDDAKHAAPLISTHDQFPETTDEDVNKFYGETQHMIPKDSAEHPDNAKKISAEDKLEGPRISQSEYARAFQQARDSSKSFEKSKSKGLDLE